MLILTRRVGESIFIGGTVKVTVLHIEGQQTKLGIEAPIEIPILRAELLDRRPRSVTTPAANKGSPKAARPRGVTRTTNMP